MGAGATRRAALRRGLAVGGGAALGAPVLLRTAQAVAVARDDAELIDGLLRVEQTAVVAYGAALGVGGLNRGFASTVRSIRRQERQHAGALAAALRARGGIPPAPPRPGAIRGLGALRSQRDVASFALALEGQAVGAYHAAVQRLRSPRLLRTTAQIMANEGQHMVILRQALGRDPLPQAFETGGRR